MRTKRWLFRLIRIGLALGFLAAGLRPVQPAEAGWRSLTGLLPDYTTLYDAAFSPDSAYLVYLADVDVEERWELYSVPLAGGQPKKLSQTLEAGGSVLSLAVTPDSQYVIYTAAQSANDEPDLYRVPINGGEVKQLNVGPMAGHDVDNVQVDPDNVYVVYVAEGATPGQDEVFSVPILGGEATRLNPDLIPTGNVYDFRIDPYLNRVVYRADQVADQVIGLYGVPIGGGVAAPLSPDGARTSKFRLSPTAGVVVYEARPQGSTQTRLYSNATDGSAFAALSGYITSNENVIGFQISPNGAKVVFNVATGSPIPSFGSLYSVSVSGGEATPITIFAPGDGAYASDITFSRDSQLVVYTATYFFEHERYMELHSAAVDGTAWQALYAEVGEEVPSAFDVSPNSDWVVFRTDPSQKTYITPITEAQGLPLPTAYYAGFTPDGSRVLLAIPNAEGYAEIYSVLLDGSDPRNLTRFGSDAATTGLLVSPDGHWIVIGVAYAASGRVELRLSDGGAAAYQVFVPLIAR